jgi:2Fe-2S ferredoxin
MPMPRLTVVDRVGQVRDIEAASGVSAMENLRAAGFDELLAICGGSCSCATCHVYVDESWADRVGPPGRDEDDLLDSSEHRRATSRLSCQIRVDDALGGLRLTIAPED